MPVHSLLRPALALTAPAAAAAESALLVNATDQKLDVIFSTVGEVAEFLECTHHLPGYPEGYVAAESLRLSGRSMEKVRLAPGASVRFSRSTVASQQVWSAGLTARSIRAASVPYLEGFLTFTSDHRGASPVAALETTPLQSCQGSLTFDCSTPGVVRMRAAAIADGGKSKDNARPAGSGAGKKSSACIIL